MAGFTSANGILLILIVSAAYMFTVSTANRGWSYGFNNTHRGGGWGGGWGWGWGDPEKNDTQIDAPNKIIVGGSNQWQFGFDYYSWAFQNSPFFVNDTLVFKYDPPNGSAPPHSVYMFRNFRDFIRCDIRRATMIANNTQGSGDGFEFVLQRWQPYYFACGERNGIHCRVGKMRFYVMPMLRRWHY